MIRWFSSRRKQRPTGPKRVLAPAEEIAEQGVLVAEVALKLTVKNAIIMNALAKREDYSVDRVQELVRETLNDLATEREADAKRLETVIADIDKFGHSGWGESDYGFGDNETIKHRYRVYLLVAAALRERMTDTAYVQKMGEDARTAAWAEIADSLKTKAEHPYYGGGRNAEYFEKREERIQHLIEKDLTKLVRERAKSRKK